MILIEISRDITTYYDQTQKTTFNDIFAQMHLLLHIFQVK